MNKRLILLLVAMVTLCGAASAQTRKAVRINEVMVQNTPEGYADDYGAHPAWIELFNSNFAPIEISTMFLSVDTNPVLAEKVLYPIPLGDVNTKIPKRQHIVFFADGEPNKGTFHTNFVLEAGKDNVVYLYDTDTTLIDSVVVPAIVLAGQSWARVEDGKGEFDLRDGVAPGKYITPSSANIIKDANDKIQDFRERDENGFGMTIMAMCIVFSALLCLCLCFYAIGKINSKISRKNKAKATDADAPTSEVSHDTGEEIAAIVMALHEHLDAHDRESTILTINKVKKAYSPWSSKIYNMREVPQHNTRR